MSGPGLSRMQRAILEGLDGQVLPATATIDTEGLRYWSPARMLGRPLPAKVRVDLSRSLARLEARGLLVRLDRDGRPTALPSALMGHARQTAWVRLTPAGQRLTAEIVSRSPRSKSLSL